MDLTTENEVANNTIGGRIRAVRKEKGMTQKALAKKLNWVPSQISKIETGFYHAKPEDIKRVAEKLGVREAYLVGETKAKDDPTALMSELERQFFRITTTNTYLPPKEVYEEGEISGATVATEDEYLVMERKTGIFDLLMAIARINEDCHLTEAEQKNRLAEARQKFAEQGSEGDTKTYLVLTPEQLAEIVEQRAKTTLRLHRATTYTEVDDEQ